MTNKTKLPRTYKISDHTIMKFNLHQRRQVFLEVSRPAVVAVDLRDGAFECKHTFLSCIYQVHMALKLVIGRYICIPPRQQTDLVLNKSDVFCTN
jgi:hypothetical protein